MPARKRTITPVMPESRVRVSPGRQTAPNALLRLGERVRGSFGVSPAAKTVKLTPRQTLNVIDMISGSVQQHRPAFAAQKKDEKPLLWKGPPSAVDAGWGVEKANSVADWLGRETVKDAPLEVSIEVKELGRDGKVVKSTKVKGEVLKK